MNKTLAILLFFLTFATCTPEGPFIYESEFLETYDLRSDDIRPTTSTNVYGSVLTANNDLVVLTGSPDIEMVSFDDQLERKWEQLFESFGVNRPSKIIDVGDGLVVIGDERNDTNAISNLLIFKTDYEGEVIFEYLESFSFDTKGISIVQNSNDELVYVAERQSTTSAVSTDVMIGKLSENGELVWSQIHNFNFNDDPMDILEKSEGGYIVLSQFGVSPVGFRMYSFDEEGVYESEIDLELTNTVSTSSFGVGHFYNLINTEDGGYFLTVHSPDDFEEPHFETSALKLDKDFNIIWKMDIANIAGEGITQTRDGSYIIYGATSLDGDIDSIYLVKVDENGELLWERQYNDFPNQMHAKSVIENDDGTLLVLSDRSSNFVLFKTDGEGNPL